ncbi:hypothetical protein [Aquimarina megaterium]|uniref:hypothetical protein n=1 Tax=Aquimarina megaterium TaxID=1443666 RepID=UPI000944B9B8|nr:hypothetical protein [Aquimarina megaterium]
MKKNVVVLGLFFHLFLFSQEVQVNTELNSDGTSTVLSAYAKPIVTNYSEESITGSKYHEEEYMIAEVYLDNKKIHKCAVRYDAYSDEIEVAANDKKYVLSKGEGIKTILKDYEYQRLDQKGNTGYFIIFNKNKETSLVLKAKKKIKEAVEPKSGFGNYVPPSFIKDYKYFIKNRAGDLTRIKLKKKDVLGVLKDKKEELEKFAASKKLKFKKESDLVKIINYYNTLL